MDAPSHDAQPQGPQRLSLNFGADLTSPVLCLMFAGTLARRLTRDLKWKHTADKYKDDYYEVIENDQKLMNEQWEALNDLDEAIYNTLLEHEPFPAKLEAEIWEEVKKRPQWYSPTEADGVDSNESIRKLNDRIYGLSKIYVRSLPGDHVDEAPNVTNLHTSLWPWPDNMNYDEEEMQKTIRMFRYRFECMEMADRYANFLHHPQPQAETCRHFNPEEFIYRPMREKLSGASEEQIIKSTDGVNFFPLPRWVDGGVRFQFSKPHRYIDACREYSGLSVDQYCERNKVLVKAFEEELDRSIDWLKTQPMGEPFTGDLVASRLGEGMFYVWAAAERNGQLHHLFWDKAAYQGWKVMRGEFRTAPAVVH